MSLNNPFKIKTRESAVTKTETIYSAELPSTSAFTEMEGTPWVGTVFNQILGVDDEPRQLDIQLDPTLQQYRKIHDFEFLLDGSLDYSNDPATGIDTITANMAAYSVYTPEAGDMWLATMPGGDVGLFTVISSERDNYRQQSAHVVTAKLFSYPSSVELDNLDIKTVENLYFNGESKGLSVHPRDDRNGHVVDISKIVALYYDEFYDWDTETFLVPSENGDIIYDPAMASFMQSIMPRNYRNINPRVRLYNVENQSPKSNFKTILDLLMRSVSYPLKLIPNKLVSVPSMTFGSFNVRYNVALSKIDTVIYPSGIPINDTAAHTAADTDPYYICSKAFYESDVDNYTDLDKYVDMYLNGKAIQYNDLVPLVNSLPEATPLDRFYSFPVYFLLALNALR